MSGIRRSVAVYPELLAKISKFAAKHKLTKLTATDLLIEKGLKVYEAIPSLLDNLAKHK